MKYVKISGSSNIAAVAYHNGDLMINFVKGTWYLYPGATEGQFSALINAESPGKHFHANIKGKLQARLMDKSELVKLEDLTAA